MKDIDQDVECLDTHRGECKGAVEYRESLTGTGTRIPRCDAHWEKRLDLEDEINQRYPANPPSDWSPLDAGEHWSEEDY